MSFSPHQPHNRRFGIDSVQTLACNHDARGPPMMLAHMGPESVAVHFVAELASCHGSNPCIVRWTRIEAQHAGAIDASKHAILHMQQQLGLQPPLLTAGYCIYIMLIQQQPCESIPPLLQDPATIPYEDLATKHEGVL